MVYTAALLGVVLDLDSYQQQHFDKHTEDVMSIAVHEGLGVCATGQLDPKGRSKARVATPDALHSTAKHQNLEH